MSLRRVLTRNLKILGVVLSIVFATLVVLVKTATAGLSVKVIVIGGLIPLPYNVDFINTVALMLIALLTPLGVLARIEARRLKSIERTMPRFLDDLSEMVRAGVPMTRAFEELAERDYGALTRIIRRIATKVRVGVDLADAIEAEMKGLSPMTKRLLVMVAEAYRSGGRAAAVLREVSAFTRMLRLFEEERERNLKVYRWIVYLAIMVFLATSAVLLYLSESIYEMSMLAGPGILRGFLTPEVLTGILYYTSIMVSLFSGFVIGKVTERRAMLGVPHVVALLVMNMLFFNNMDLIMRLMPKL